MEASQEADKKYHTFGYGFFSLTKLQSYKEITSLQLTSPWWGW